MSEDSNRIIEELNALRAHRQKMDEARASVDQVLAMLGRLLESDGDPAFGQIAGCTEAGEWSASVTLSGDNWIRVIAALEGVEPDAIRAYLALGGS